MQQSYSDQPAVDAAAAAPTQASATGSDQLAAAVFEQRDATPPPAEGAAVQGRSR